MNTQKPDDSLSRAQARAMLTRPGGPPSLNIHFVAPTRDANENIGAPTPCEVSSATVRNGHTEKNLTRGACESARDFEKRVCDELPACGAGMAIFWPDDSERGPAE
ncbi:MAG: hypothetical protein ACRD4V_02860 [Candidatus Acidiferrales bacterium]